MLAPFTIFFGFSAIFRIELLKLDASYFLVLVKASILPFTKLSRNHTAALDLSGIDDPPWILRRRVLLWRWMVTDATSLFIAERLKKRALLKLKPVLSLFSMT